MTALLLRLAAPMQSWGDSSRFVRRQTRPEPTKSGVLGLLAAAQGRRRSDEIEDLAELTFGVRIDQPGRLIRDFHTAHTHQGHSMPLSYRFYLGDALFLAAVQGERELLTSLDRALRHPTFPLYLGRRSCPPVGPVSMGVRDGTVAEVLHMQPWAASTWRQRQTHSATVDLEIVRDAAGPHESGEMVRDVPHSFDPVRREYRWRSVIREMVVGVANRYARPEDRGDIRAVAAGAGSHEPMSLLGGF